MSPGVRFSLSNRVGKIILDQPHYLNALTETMIDLINDQLNHWDNSVDTIYICSSSKKAFCVGGDIRKFYENGYTKISDSIRAYAKECRLMKRIYHLKVPYISMVDGLVMGAGVGLAIHGEMSIATKNLLLSMPEVNIGFFPDVGASLFLSKLPKRVGWYLALTGRSITIADAFDLKLITHVVSRPISSEEIGDIDRYLVDPGKAPLAKYYDRIEMCFSSDDLVTILADLKKQNDPWCHKVAQEIEKKAPMSLRVALENLLVGQDMSFDEVIDMEEKKAELFFQGRDLYEGIRATLIDKDYNPLWQDR